MKFKVDREKFRKVLNIVKLAQGTGSVNNNEWVKGIKIETENKDSLRLTATDTTATISAVVDGVNIEKEGSILLSGDIIDMITSKQADSELTLELDNNIVKLVCGNDKSEVEIMRDDFIGIDLSKANSWISLPIKLFLMADSKVCFAAHQDNGVRPKMQAVYFKAIEKSMDIVACDGRKLAKLSLNIEDTVPPDFFALIRHDIVTKISKALSDFVSSDGKVDICMNSDKMYIKSGTFLATANLVNDKYIKYDKIILASDKINLSIGCNRKDLLRKVELAGFINKSSKDSNGISNIGIKVSDEGFGEGYLSVVSYKTASNKHNSEISVTQEQGTIPSDFCIWADSKNILDILKKFDSERIIIDFQDANNPFIVRDKENPNYLTLVMPQTVQPAKKE